MGDVKAHRRIATRVENATREERRSGDLHHLFVYFEIHSCSRDAVVSPEDPRAGSTASSARQPTSSPRIAISAVSPETLGTLMTTVDGAETWSGSTIEAGNLNDLYFIDRSIGWVVGKDGSLYSTLDGGGSWTKNDCEGFPPDEDFYKVPFFGQSIGYVLGYGGVYNTEQRRRDWGNNWLPEAPYRGAWDMSFVDDRTGYLLGGRYLESDPVFLYRTRNGGEEWEPVAGSKASVLSTVIDDMVRRRSDGMGRRRRHHEDGGRRRELGDAGAFGDGARVLLSRFLPRFRGGRQDDSSNEGRRRHVGERDAEGRPHRRSPRSLLLRRAWTAGSSGAGRTRSWGTCSTSTPSFSSRRTAARAGRCASFSSTTRLSRARRRSPETDSGR